MKKQRPNRMSKRNRKFIKHTEAFRRRMETQKHQRESAAEGILYPRSLARSVGKNIGSLAEGISLKNAAFNWKAYCEAAMKVPNQNPNNNRKINRTIRKLEGVTE